jgi:hypothetical protein
MLANLAGYTLDVLQALPPADGSGSSSSSSSSAGYGGSPNSSISISSTYTCPRQHAGTALLPAAQEPASPVTSATLSHEHLWQRLGFAPAMLPLVAAAERKNAHPEDPYMNFQLAANAAASALEQAVASAAELSSQQFGRSASDVTASDLSAAQLQLAVAAMPVPLLLTDTVAQISSRNADDAFTHFTVQALIAAPKYLACLGLVAAELNQAAGGRRSSLSMGVWDLPVQQLLQQAAQHMQELLASSSGQGSSDSVTRQSNSNSSSSASSINDSRMGPISSSSSKGEASGPTLVQFPASSHPCYPVQMFDGWLKFAAELSRLAPHCKFVASEQQQAVCQQLAQGFTQLLQQYLRLLLQQQQQPCVQDAHSALWAAFRNSLSCLCLNDLSSSGLGAMVTEVVGSGSSGQQGAAAAAGAAAELCESHAAADATA